MLTLVRLAALAFVLLFALSSARAADKPFQRADLGAGAIKLEAQIKSDAKPLTKPLSVLSREADIAFERRDMRTGIQILGQIAAIAPNDSGNWLRLARAILKVAPTTDSERTVLIERAATAAFIAYQRTKDPTEEAESLVLLGRTFGDRKLWRPALDALRLSLELREVAEARALYERVREEHGFRILDYSVDSDAAAPRACFQFSEGLAGKRTDFSPFVSVAGQQRPALSTDDKQLCVEGLRHGESYAVTLRAGLPSAVREGLTKSAEFNVYVRDRSPSVHFAGNAYVLPRSGQRGIPIISVNTDQVAVEIYRVGDRNLVGTVLGSDFKHNLYRYDVERLRAEQGAEVWRGDLQVESTLNADITTAFPVDTAVGALAPGVYVMVAQPTRSVSEGALASQWFIVSDLGLTAFSATDGITAFVHSLATTEAKSGSFVRLMARNNEVLATRTTDAAGVAHFEAGLARGEGGLAPAMLIAEQTGDYAFLSLKAPAFDLSDRGVSGRLAPAGLDAMVFTERGVYRTGETVNITTLLRDAQGAAAVGIPLTLTVNRPDGVEYRRAVVADQGIGGRSLSVPIVDSALTGTWQVRVFTDPKGQSIGHTTFMVEDYLPDRLEFELTTQSRTISTAAPAGVTVAGRFLYGAPASGLQLEAEISIAPAKERPGFPGYRFGVADDQTSPHRQVLEALPETDAQGKAHFTAAVNELPATSQPLEARIMVTMRDSGGRGVERNLILPVRPPRDMIGVKPLFDSNALQQGEKASFDVIVAAPDGTTGATRLHWQLLQVESRYQWYRQDGEWQFEPVKITTRRADGDLDVPVQTPGRLELPVNWGRYRLEIGSDDPNGPMTSVSFDAGWYADASADVPDNLELALDKPEYRPDETMTLAVDARVSGKLTLAVVAERLISTTTVDVQPGLTRIPLTVGQDWGTGAYVVATLRRPLEAGAARMPGRAIGVRWFAIDRLAHTLQVAMKLPDLMRPRQALHIPITVGKLAPGEEARIVVAAVDVGILNLTSYKAPAPDDYYWGQRRLAAEIRDLYGQLIDGMHAQGGEIRSGGDVAAGELTGSPPTQPPLALYSGVVTVGQNGEAAVSFAVPDFAGTVRVMAVAWSKDKLGHAVGDVLVRDPVVLTATLPRYLLLGDRGSVRLELDNVDGPAGDYRVELAPEGPLELREAPRIVKLATQQRGGVSSILTASGVGHARLAIHVSGPGGLELTRTYPLWVKPATHVLTRRTVKALAQGESVTLTGDLLTDLVPGTGSLAVSVGSSAAMDVPALLRGLERYPFGCAEQIASRALPLLYVTELAAEAHLDLDTTIDQTIRESIDRLLARQGSNGSFGLWSIGGEDAWLDAYVTDFLTRARERGFVVPDTAFKLALGRLRNYVAIADDPSKEGGGLAYVLYVLAKNGLAPIGDLRYIADAKLGQLRTSMAKAQIAAALGLLGDRVRAERVYAAALQTEATEPRLEVGRTDFGSSLRDAAALVTLASESGSSRLTVLRAVERVEAARAFSRSTSTQEDAWLILAARAITKEEGAISLDVAGQSRQGPLFRTFRAAELEGGLSIANRGEGRVQAVVSVSGAPLVPEPATERGFKIERLFYTLDGTPADPTAAKQNQRFVVLLRITEAQPQFGRIVAADYLPAGFEIDNPHLVSSGETGALSWIRDAVEPVSTEFRDDRFAAAFNRAAEDRPVFTVAYVVRAVSPGRYLLPQAYVEDMYRPDRFGRTGSGVIEVSSPR